LQVAGNLYVHNADHARPHAGIFDLREQDLANLSLDLLGYPGYPSLCCHFSILRFLSSANFGPWGVLASPRHVLRTVADATRLFSFPLYFGSMSTLS
jgi:hypothetical protein